MNLHRFFTIVLLAGLVVAPGASSAQGSAAQSLAPAMSISYIAGPSADAGVSLPARVSVEWWARVQADIRRPEYRTTPIAPVPIPFPWAAESNQEGALFSLWVDTAGDVNGDGYDDVIVGADHYGNGQVDEGRAFVYYGSASGPSTTPDWIAEGNQDSAFFSHQARPAGDVNGDGYADVIVAAPAYDNGQVDEGRAFVYYGSAAGLSTSPNWTAEGDQDGAHFGHAAGTAGDVNGDGYDDVIIGAEHYSNGQSIEGRAYVYYGSAMGLSPTPNWMAESNQDDAEFGHSAGTAGDVNRDGYADVVVGAPMYDNGQEDEGRAFVYYGSASGPSISPDWLAEGDQDGADFGHGVATAGDVNGDGYDDVIIGASSYDKGQVDEGRAFAYYGSAAGLSISPDWTADGNQVDAQFGHSARTAGDFNGDGYDDVIIGADLYDDGQVNEGRAFAYYGSAAGLSTSPDWTVESNQVGAQLGFPVGTAGDVNGDGYADVIVSVRFYDHGQTDEGMAVVYAGRAR